MDGLVLKPFKPAHLRRAVAGYLGRPAAMPLSADGSPGAPGLAPRRPRGAGPRTSAGDLCFISHLVDLFAELVPEAARTLEIALAARRPAGDVRGGPQAEVGGGHRSGVEPLHALLAEIERLADEGQTAPLPAAVEAAIATAAAAVDELARLLPRTP